MSKISQRLGNLSQKQQFWIDLVVIVVVGVPLAALSPISENVREAIFKAIVFALVGSGIRRIMDLFWGYIESLEDKRFLAVYNIMVKDPLTGIRYSSYDEYLKAVRDV